jgi:hypothetical protein
VGLRADSLVRIGTRRLGVALSGSARLRDRDHVEIRRDAGFVPEYESTERNGSQACQGAAWSMSCDMCKFNCKFNGRACCTVDTGKLPSRFIRVLLVILDGMVLMP